MSDPDSRTDAGLTRSFFPRGRLQQIIGARWLVDGVLQLQPVMFTPYLATPLRAARIIPCRVPPTKRRRPPSGAAS